MHPNIKSIWNQAASSHQQESTSWATQQSFLTRYTELVVAEIHQFINDRGDHSDGRVLCHKISDHFGFQYDPVNKKHSR